VRVCTSPGPFSVTFFSARGPKRYREWRRWTGIEPAGRGAPVPPALKAGEPTRCPDTSASKATLVSAGATTVRAMKKLLILAVLIAVGVVAARKLQGS
jgi:hypothetical protein